MPLPRTGRPADEVRRDLDSLAHDDLRFKEGRAFGLTFNPDHDVQALAEEAYLGFISKNGLDFTQFPSLLRLETDITTMVKHQLGLEGDAGCGSFTSGGTESILLAVKTARDRFREQNPHVERPRMLIPVSAHAAFWKAAHYLDVDFQTLPVETERFTVRPETVEAAIDERTFFIVGSSPNYTYGTIDPIAQLGEIAEKHDIWLHSDACMGGMLLPYFAEAGRDIPAWDFSVPGVRSISCDLHKYGYALKGASVVVYRDRSLRSHQWFVGGDWMGYPLVNATVQSTKSGGALAAAWTTLNTLGDDGYRDLARQHMEITDALVEGIDAVDGVRMSCRPDYCIFAFTTEPGKCLFDLADRLKERGWYVQPILRQGELEACIHMTVSFRNFARIDEFLSDLKETTAAAKKNSIPLVLRPVIKGLAAMDPDRLTEERVVKLMNSFGVDGAITPGSPMALINAAMNDLSPAMRNKLLRIFSNRLF